MKDVREIDGVWCMTITDEGDGKVKNAASLRTIPLHPKVVEEGFVRWRQHRKGAPDDYLFRELDRETNALRPMSLDGGGRLTESYSKRFSRVLRVKLGITSKALVFHSFRHTWEDAAEAAIIPQTHRRDLAGRSKAGDSQAVYGRGPSMKALHASLATIDPLANR